MQVVCEKQSAVVVRMFADGGPEWSVAEAVLQLACALVCLLLNALGSLLLDGHGGL